MTTQAPPQPRARLRPADPAFVLTPAECDVLTAMAAGLSNQGIGARMYLSAKTVECHIGAIFRKLCLETEPHGNRRVQAVLIWLGYAGPTLR